MKEQEKKNRIIKEVIKPLLKNAGYKVCGNTCISEREECYVCIYIQNSKYNLEPVGYTFWLNIGIEEKSQMTEEAIIKQHGAGEFINEAMFLPNHGLIHPYHNACGYTIGGTQNKKLIETDYDACKRRIINDFETCILKELKEIQSIKDWKDLNQRLFEKQYTKRNAVISFFSRIPLLACSEANIGKTVQEIQEGNLTKNEILEYTDLFNEVIKYADDYGTDARGFLMKVLECIN